MKRFSLFKLIVALCICNTYIFCCAVTGNVVGSEPVESDVNQPDDKKLSYGGTVDFIGNDDKVVDSEPPKIDISDTSDVTVENLGFAKPAIISKPVSSSYNANAAVLSLLGKSEESSSTSTSLSSVKPDIVITNPKPISSSSSSAVSSSSVSSSSVSSSSSSSTISSSTVSSLSSSGSSSIVSEESQPDIPAPNYSTPPEDNTPPNSDTNKEILRVTYNGSEVTGNAVDIVTQTVENEIGATFAPEAIKAQAVTTYTYIKYCNLHGRAPSVMLKDSTNNSVRTLVESVIGEGIYYNGELIQAVYSASSAGCTASSENVWGNPLPYLKSVYCELDEKFDPNWGKTVTFSENEIKSRIFNNAGIALEGDPSTWFVIENRTEGKYVGDMTIGGQQYFIDKDGDTLRVTGRRFREIIMDFDIRSAAFDIDYNSATQEFTITTYGYGHGVGLSQNGAHNLARQWGWDYKQILTFYFTGTEVH